MSYRLINANDLNGKISDEDYEVVLKEPCIYADLPNGMDGKGYEVIPWEKIPKDATNGDVIKAMFPTAKFYCAERLQTAGMPRRNADFDVDWWNAPYKAESEEV